MTHMKRHSWQVFWLVVPDFLCSGKIETGIEFVEDFNVHHPLSYRMSVKIHI
jgi:hypothetical protein